MSTGENPQLTRSRRGPLHPHGAVIKGGFADNARCLNNTVDLPGGEAPSPRVDYSIPVRPTHAIASPTTEESNAKAHRTKQTKSPIYRALTIFQRPTNQTSEPTPETAVHTACFDGPETIPHRHKPRTRRSEHLTHKPGPSPATSTGTPATTEAGARAPRIAPLQTPQDSLQNRPASDPPHCRRAPFCGSPDCLNNGGSDLGLTRRA
jgi:hypothetical protein